MMNERIKELAVHARNYALDEKRIYERIHNTEQCMEEYREVYNKKFAELIVRECVDSMEKCFAGGIGTDNNKDVWGPSASTFKAWNGAIKFSRDKIKEHFGVE
jgi:hypothetical protein